MSAATPDPGRTVPPLTSAEAFDKLVPVMADGQLNAMVTGLEPKLIDKSAQQVSDLVSAAGMNLDLLHAALVVRRDIGRLNDLIHALAIGLTLQAVLEPDERIVDKPSLAAGNNALSQHFDVLTTVRAAEFKVSVWNGHDSQRRRGLVGDLINLARHTPPTCRSSQLFVVGPRPEAWLRSTTAKLSWALNGAKASTVTAASELGTRPDMSISEFRVEHASRVEVVDLNKYIPSLTAMLTPTAPST